MGEGFRSPSAHGRARRERATGFTVHNGGAGKALQNRRATPRLACGVLDTDRSHYLVRNRGSLTAAPQGAAVCLPGRHQARAPRTRDTKRHDTACASRTRGSKRHDTARAPRTRDTKRHHTACAPRTSTEPVPASHGSGAATAATRRTPSAIEWPRSRDTNGCRGRPSRLRHACPVQSDGRRPDANGRVSRSSGVRADDIDHARRGSVTRSVTSEIWLKALAASNRDGTQPTPAEA